MPRLLTPAQVAEVLQVSRQHASDLMKTGALGVVVYLPKVGGRQQVRLPEGELEAFIARGGARPPAAPPSTAPKPSSAPGYYAALMRQRGGQKGGRGTR